MTESCQLRCTYCRPAASDDESVTCRRPLDSAELLTLVSHLHAATGIDKLRFTGGEPLLRRDLPELIAACAKMDIRDISLTTNGQRLSALAPALRDSGLDRINISLDSLDPVTFARITRGGDLGATLAGIDAVLAQGMAPVKLNMVVLRGINDCEIAEVLEFSLRTGCQVRFLELMPIGVAADDFERQFVSSIEVRESLLERYQFEAIPGELGATSRDFLVEDGRGRKTVCGFISPTSHPFCEGCNRLRLTHDGRLLGCLAHRESVDLLPALRAAAHGGTRPLAQALGDALAMKTWPRCLSDQRDMARIGG